MDPVKESFNKWFYTKNYTKTKTGLFAKMLAEITGVKLPLTKSGSISLSKSAISALSEDEPLVQFILYDNLDPHMELAVYERMHYASEGTTETVNISSKSLTNL